MQAREFSFIQRHACRWFLAAVGGLAAMLVAGCQEEEGIKTYTVPKPERQADNRPLRVAVPENWQKASQAPMSIATYRVSEGNESADITITPLSGMGGGLLGNINRWRGQIKLPTIDDETQVRKDLQEIQVDGIAGHAVDLLGPEGAGRQRIVAVIVPRNDTTWFFRMKGPATLVEKQKLAFDEFMASVRFAGKPGGK